MSVIVILDAGGIRKIEIAAEGPQGADLAEDLEIVRRASPDLICLDGRLQDSPTESPDFIKYRRGKARAARRA